MAKDETRETAATDPRVRTQPEPPDTPALLVRSPKKLAQPKPGDLPMDMNRLALYHDEPHNSEYVKAAKDLLMRCGPLVLDGVQYSYNPDRDKIETVATEFRGIDRARIASGIEKMKIENV